jgi:SAM-dependent methyltransferase
LLNEIEGQERNLVRDEILRGLLAGDECTRILNVGAGKGIESIYFAIKFNKFSLCIDEYEGNGDDRNNETWLREKIKDLKIEDLIEIQKQDILKADLKDGSYDLIFAKNVMHHIFENRWDEDLRDNLFKKLRNSCGKAIYIQETGRINYKAWLRFIIPRSWKTINTIHVVDYSQKCEPYWWADGLVGAGFKNIKVVYHIPNRLRALALLVPGRHLSRMGSGSYAVYAEP